MREKAVKDADEVRRADIKNITTDTLNQHTIRLNFFIVKPIKHKNKMAVLYKLHQDNRSNSKHKGEWYARAKMLDIVELDELAQLIQDNTTAKKADAQAVLTEMVEQMKGLLQKSYAVRIPGLGIFKIGLRTSAAPTAKEFSAAKNVKGMRLNFINEWTIDKNGQRTINMLHGATVKELPQNAVSKGDGDQPEP